MQCISQPSFSRSSPAQTPSPSRTGPVEGQLVASVLHWLIARAGALDVVWRELEERRGGRRVDVRRFVRGGGNMQRM
jgi:hypothetical protein